MQKQKKKPPTRKGQAIKRNAPKGEKKRAAGLAVPPIGDNVPENFPHFRYYKKSGHPALITAEHSETEYKYRKVMHGDRDGRHPNEKVYPNPNPKDSKPMYIGKRVRHDEKRFFSKWKYPWNYPGKTKKR